MKKGYIISAIGLAVVGIIIYNSRKNKTEEASNIEGGGGAPACVTTCESTPSNPNQAPTVYAGACTPNLANQPYAGYHSITRCGGAVKRVPIGGLKAKVAFKY